MVFSSRIPLAALIQLCRVLKHNLSAGIMLRDVFRQQGKRGPIPVRPVAARIAVSLEQGESLAQALRQEKAAFPPLFLSLASVGESTGNLPEIFGELERYYIIQQKFWRLFVQQSVLPVFQFVAATFVIAFLMFILGWISEVVHPGTKAIEPIGLGLTGKHGAIVFLSTIYGTLGGLAFAYLLISRSLRQKALVDRFFLRVPVIGPFLETLSLARFCLALHLTMDSAMPIIEALTLSLSGTGNAAYAACFEVVDESLRSGEDVTTALSRTGIFPSDFINIVASAEEGGRVPEAMAGQATTYAEEAERRLQILARVAGFGVWMFVATLIIIAIFKIFMIYLNALSGAMPH